MFARGWCFPCSYMRRCCALFLGYHFTPSVETCQDQLFRRAAFERGQGLQNGWLEAAMVAWVCVDDLAAADSCAGRRDAQDKAITPGYYRRPAETQLHPG